MIRSLVSRTHPIVRKDTRRRPPRSRLRRVLSGPLSPLVLMLLLVALGAWLNYEVYCALSSMTYYPYYHYGPPDQVGAVLYYLYYGLAFAILLGGWMTGLLGVSAGGPLIAQEFKRRTWDVLAATPLSNAEITRAKFAAGMWHLRHWLTAQFTLRWVFVFFSLGLLIIDLTLPSNVRYILQGDSEAWARDAFARAPLSGVVFCLALTLFALAQPVLTAATGVSLGALCSTLTWSPSLARGLALAARTTLWVCSWGSVFYFMGRLGYWKLDYASSQLLQHVIQIASHMYDPAQLAGALSEFGHGWLLIAGLALIVALALVPAWLCLRLASAVLSRRRA